MKKSHWSPCFYNNKSRNFKTTSNKTWKEKRKTKIIKETTEEDTKPNIITWAVGQKRYSIEHNNSPNVKIWMLAQSNFRIVRFVTKNVCLATTVSQGCEESLNFSTSPSYSLIVLKITSSSESNNIWGDFMKYSLNLKIPYVQNNHENQYCFLGHEKLHILLLSNIESLFYWIKVNRYQFSTILSV